MTRFIKNNRFDKGDNVLVRTMDGMRSAVVVDVYNGSLTTGTWSDGVREERELPANYRVQYTGTGNIIYISEKQIDSADDEAERQAAIAILDSLRN